jgi:hypothetical protein
LVKINQNNKNKRRQRGGGKYSPMQGLGYTKSVKALNGSGKSVIKLVEDAAKLKALQGSA